MAVMTKVSIVIPVFNEAENLPKLIAAIGDVMVGLNRPFELILVDDGSDDDSWKEMLSLESQYSWIRCFGLVRNYGQSTALQAGFDQVTGKYVVTLDADLQNDPADIPAMLKILDQDNSVDCVSGWREFRQDAAMSRIIPSRIANALISKVTRVRLNDYGCALKAYRVQAIENIRLYGELHRFIPALVAEVGANIVEMSVTHRARRAGVSKYGLDRTFRVLLDLIWIRFTMRFLHRPIHAFGGIALLFISVGFSVLLWLVFEKFGLERDIGGRPLLMLGVLMTLVGIQLLGTGLIGELLIRIYHEPKGRSQYILKINSRNSSN